MSLKISTAASARNVNTVNLHAIHYGKCSFTSQAKNHGLPSPVRCQRGSSREQTVSTSSRKSLPKNVLKKNNQHGAVKQLGISKHDSKQLPSKGARTDNITQLSSNNRRALGERATGDFLTTTEEAPAGGSNGNESTHVCDSSNSDNHPVPGILLGSPSADNNEVMQTEALLMSNISANCKVHSLRNRFCPVSASDTTIVVRKRQCVSCCPSTRRHTEDVTKNVDCSITGQVQAQYNDDYRGDQKNNSQHANLDIGEIIIDNEMQVISLKSSETSPLNPQENLVCNKFPIETTAGTSSCCQSQASTSRNCELSPPVLPVGDISVQQTKSSLLAKSFVPGKVFDTTSQDQHPSTGFNDNIQHTHNSPPDITAQQPNCVSNSKKQDGNPMPWSFSEELIAKLLPECSFGDEDTCFDQMVELALRILYTMYIKESSKRSKETSTPETDRNELPHNPGVETVKSNYKQKSKDTAGSSLFVKRWNSHKCIQDTKPLLQVKYNAPVRPSSRSASRSVRSELRTKSVSPKKLQKHSSDKPSTYVKNKVFVHLTDDAASPKKAEQLKKRPNVASTSPRNLGLMAHRDQRVSSVIKIIPDLQTRVLKTEQASVILNKNKIKKSKINTTPVMLYNSARVKKINYRSSNWCRTNDTQKVRRGVFNDNEKSNAKNKKCTLDDRLLPSRTKQKRCWTSLDDQTPASVTTLRANSQCRNRTKATSTVLDHNLVDCKERSNGKLPAYQEVSPRRSYGMENILFGDLNDLGGAGEKSYAKPSSNQTHKHQRAASLSIKDKPIVNIGAGECIGVSENCHLLKPDQLLRDRKSHCDIEKYKADEQKLDRMNVPICPDLHKRQTLVQNEPNTKRRHQKWDQENLKDDMRFLPQSRSVENSRNRQEHPCCYSKQHARGESISQDESRKFKKYQGHRLKYNCEDSKDGQISKHRNVHTLTVNKAHPNRPMYWKAYPTGLEYSNVNTFSDRVATNSNISTPDSPHVDLTQLILPGRSHTKESNGMKDKAREHVQSGENIHCYSLPVNPQAIKNTFNRDYQQLPARKKNVLPNSKRTSKTESSLVHLFDDDDSSSRILPELSWMSMSYHPKNKVTEIVEAKDISCELDEAQVTERSNRARLIQPELNYLGYQNYLSDSKCQCNRCIPKRRNLSRWHVIGHPEKDLKMGQRAMISARRQRDDEEGHTFLFSSDEHGRCNNTCQQTVIKDCQRRMKNPCGHVIPGYFVETGETPLLEGGELSLPEKHLQYTPAGDGFRPGKVTTPKHCYLQSEVQQFCAENSNKNKSGISSYPNGNITPPKDCYFQSAVQQSYAKNCNKNKSMISSNDSSLNETNLQSAQTRTTYLETNTDLSRVCDKTAFPKNGLQSAYVHSDSGQSEKVEMDNLIMFKEENVDKFHSDCLYLLPHNLTKSHKHLCISEIRWISTKAQQDKRMINWTNERERQGNLVKRNTPRGHQNYCGHTFICTEKTLWAHGWNKLQKINIQDEPLDLSRKTKRVSSFVTNVERTCDSVLCDTVPGVSPNTLFPLQSSPLNLSAK